MFECGCTVIAPYFERILSPQPNLDELQLRVAILHGALRAIRESNLPIIGIGHSIGAALILALAGGQMWMHEGQSLPVVREDCLKKLVLFAPPTGFFQAPRSLIQVQAAVQVWVGSVDKITPPQQVEVLKAERSAEGIFEIHIVEGAGHFSFMNTLPPNIDDPMKDRGAFLADLGSEICKFVMA